MTAIQFELIDMAHGGSCLGRHEGRIVFVPYTLPGEVVEAVITEEKKSYARASLLRVVRESPERVDPPCPYYGPGGCGGCHWQHIDYTSQVELKRRVVVDQLERIGRIASPDVLPTISSPSSWGYRSHATFSLSPRGEPGFFSDSGQDIIPIANCAILHPALNDLLGQVDFEIDILTRIRLQVGSDPDDRMMVIQTVDDQAPEISVDFPVSINLLLSDNEPVNLIGSPQVHYSVFHRQFRVTAGAFSQVNAPMMETLVELVLDRLNLNGTESVLDLYSGVGLFTGFIAEKADYVLSVESYPPAVTDAERNLDDQENVELVEGAVEDVLEDLVGPFEAIVVDPPRSGLDNAVIDHIDRLLPDRLVYVSCDPATLARDARKLAGHGLRLASVQPVDMFPQTFHIEAVATFIRQ
nr:class I SAM-dependent RNA methyltransferase [Anaerolineae bacterium]